MLDLTPVLRIPRLHAGFDISPDGNHVAFSWNKTGEWQIYELELDSPQDTLTEPRPLSEFSAASSLTSGPGGKIQPALDRFFRRSVKFRLRAAITFRQL